MKTISGDGKFSKNFLTSFMLKLAMVKMIRREPNFSYKDLRTISHLIKNNLGYLQTQIEEDRKFIHPETSDITINIPDKYYTEMYRRFLLSVLPRRVLLLPYKNIYKYQMLVTVV